MHHGWLSVGGPCRRKVFDELSGVVSRPSCGFKDEWDQVDAGVSVEIFLFLTFG